MLENILSLVSNFIPTSYTKIILASIIFLSGVFAGHRVTYWYYSGEVNELKGAITQYESAYNSLAESTKKQNEEILKMKSLQKKKAEELEVAQKAARNAAKTLYDDASTLLRKTSNNASDACLDASKLIDEELSKERVK